ncbi:Histone acetyltransferase ESA1 [Trichinella zimbabwensis]|uniref:histone acetyltransferase n=1 Tax=Trichinella zimbabwensis TaxID=268475 RepID=A0A0V1HEM9_9BILA|nr:Histone acetyltransferase ESA1 [Trichinella zimbabwensis]
MPNPNITYRYILSINENRICTPERPFSVEGLAAYWRYWLQRIMDYMAQKGTKRQFDIVELSNLTGIADMDIVATLFTYDMLAKEGEEYWIVMSETFRQAYRKLHLSERSRRVNNGYFMKFFYNITDVIVNAVLNSSLKHCKYEFAMFSFIFHSIQARAKVVLTD